DAAGLSFKDVVNATVYLTDIRHYAAMNAIYAKRVGQPAPARATVGTALMSPEALVEIQMTAVRPKAEK
ncbi:MAG: RidA family protein, partial [Acidobacteriota bacterium]